MNYSIAWKRDTSADYKFYHTTNSVVIPDHKHDTAPWRYPFADIFIYQIHPRHGILTYRNGWRDLKFFGKYVGEIGFDPAIKWPNGTQLVDFGYYKMRVSIENKRYLKESISPNWFEIGVTPWYNHYINRPQKVVSFKISPSLYEISLHYIIPKLTKNYITFIFDRYSLLYEI